MALSMLPPNVKLFSLSFSISLRNPKVLARLISFKNDVDEKSIDAF